MINRTPIPTPPRTPLPISAWGREAAKVAANTDFALAARDPRDDDDLDALYRIALRTQ